MGILNGGLVIAMFAVGFSLLFAPPFWRKKEEVKPVFSRIWVNLNALCDHLKRIGLSATVESKEEAGASFWGGTIGAVRVANRNIDLIILERASYVNMDEYSGGFGSKFSCIYVVQANIEDLEQGVMAEGKPVRKSFWNRQIVDFEWKGKELAQALNNDSNLRNYFISQRYPPDVVISIAHKGHQSGIRIFERGERA